MTCDAPEHALLQFAAAGSLDGEEGDRVAAHAARCGECGRDLVELRALARDLAALHLTDAEVVEAAWAGTVPHHAAQCGACRADIEVMRASKDELTGTMRAPRFALPAALAAGLGVASLGLVGWNVHLVRENRDLARGVEASRAWRDAAAEARQSAAQREEELVVARDALAAASRPALNVPIVDLVPGAARGGPSRPAAVTLAEGTPWIAVVLAVPGAVERAEHEVELRDAAGTAVWRGGGLRPGDLDTFTLALPGRLLAPGRHHLVLRRGTTVVAQYALEVRRP